MNLNKCILRLRLHNTIVSYVQLCIYLRHNVVHIGWRRLDSKRHWVGGRWFDLRWVCPAATSRTAIWPGQLVGPSLKFEWNRLVSPRFEWTLKFERSPRFEGITLRSPRIECFTYFWGWSSTCSLSNKKRQQTTWTTPTAKPASVRSMILAKLSHLKLILSFN